MLTHSSAHAELFRLTTAAALLAVGALSFLWPRCLAGVAGYFIRWAPALAPAEQDRLSRVVVAREAAEGVSSSYGRALGVAAIACAALEALPGMPAVVPYALLCLAMAAVTLAAYLQFRRASEQRVAPLVRRSPFEALPPLLIAAIGCSIAGSLALAVVPSERLGAVGVALATAVLGIIAWRVANAPALLLGDDPQCEYAVDERVRVGRARNVACLACAPAFVLTMLAEPDLPQLYGAAGSVLAGAVIAGFAVSLAASFWPLRARIRMS